MAARVGFRSFGGLGELVVQNGDAFLLDPVSPLKAQRKGTTGLTFGSILQLHL